MYNFLVMSALWNLFGMFLCGFRLPTKLSSSELYHQTIHVSQLRQLDSKFSWQLKTSGKRPKNNRQWVGHLIEDPVPV